MKPTDEQVSILDTVKTSSENLCIDALAGTGKSSTLKLIEDVLPSEPILYLVFNKDARVTAEKIFDPTKTTVKTINGLGHGVWCKTASNVSVSKTKMIDIFRQIANELKGTERNEAWDEYWSIMQACEMAKALGYIPEGIYPNARRLITTKDFYASLEETPTPFAKELIDACLAASIKAAYAGSIDFNDQVYMPALFGGTFPRFSRFLLDESQDHNPVNHAMFEKLIRGWVCAVGDPNQSIYAFRGAVKNGMSKLKDRFSMASATISYSFRCPEPVVKHVQWHVPNFKWTKSEGKVEKLNTLDPATIPDGAVILCRNNAPLFKAGLSLLGEGRSVKIAGSDIGPKLIKTLEKLGPSHMSRNAVIEAIEDWRIDKLQVSTAPQTINDTAECMKVFACYGANLGQAVAFVKHLFAQQGSIRLYTGHKSKGMGFPFVYHLDPWLCREDEQDKNLSYVISTRSEHTLLEIDSQDIQWSNHVG